MKSFYDELYAVLAQHRMDKEGLTKLKTKLSKKYKLGKIPTDIDVLLHAPLALRQKLKHLRRKPTRTLSGVAVCSLMARPEHCPHGKCIMCPGGPGSIFGDVPQSYTGREPATLRAIRNEYSAYRQIIGRLEQYAIGGHDFDKVEVIIQGGTFPAYSWAYQKAFVRDIFQALNDFGREFLGPDGIRSDKLITFFELDADFKSKERALKVKKRVESMQKKYKSDLLQAQKANEKAKVRCVGLTIETKPDWALLKHANRMLELGCTRIELGFQTDDDAVLRAINRGHGIKESVEATRILKDLAFKINYHIMLGLPKTTIDSDRKMLENLFEDERFRPDMLKIYPCMVMPGTPLYTIWKKGKFKPMRTEAAIALISEFLAKCPEYVRVMRVQRDIPTSASVAGVDRTNLRQYVDTDMKGKRRISRDIRSREIGHMAPGMKLGKPKMIVKRYSASKGTEFFISYEYPAADAIAGFCRLRLPSQNLRPELRDKTALIRELHVMGTAIAIGSEGTVQHTGIGRKLMAKAESIAIKEGCKDLLVISGVGVRQYYRKLGYSIKGPFMHKVLKSSQG